jgi:uncharacterized RDD family membrane protein YckC
MTQWGNGSEDGNPTQDPSGRPAEPQGPASQPDQGRQPSPYGPRFGQPAYQPQPVYGQQPVFGQQTPLYGQFPYEQPSYGQFPHEQPSYGQQPYGYPAAPGYAGYGLPTWDPDGRLLVPGRGPVELSSIGLRFFARLIDWMLVLTVAVSLFLAGLQSIYLRTVCDTSGCHREITGNPFQALQIIVVLTNALAFLYEFLMIALRGQTLGKMAMGIKVVRLDNGQVPGFGRAFVRQIVPVLAGLVPVCGGLLVLLVYLSVFFDRSGRKQTWYDQAAGDVVTRTR